MNGTMVTLVGTVASEVKYSTTTGGVAVANFRLAATDRRFDRQRQSWVDGDTSLYLVWSWRWLAENVLASVGRGDPLLVTGRLRIREWDSGEGRSRSLVPEIEAAAIGHDLCRGTSAFRKAVRGRPELVAPVGARPGPSVPLVPAPLPAVTGTAVRFEPGLPEPRPVLVGEAPPSGSG
ncbi:single-stranded DNA-binding protein [Streptacidiphilus sp. P02-A3a]|uniref:single-stranded DNA-binding protein n=1 Tax=Streptacidiphilus sp. P02-A3a TaxID=2704468 RepID=UPI0015FA330F|nr:single-stranded DNA-binding protein [Streptacidiphilus sp. P02-A3a]QMU68029.1 single-stranded DNA-binding protein [Streptacidiphilus sp. P02-A3a]